MNFNSSTLAEARKQGLSDDDIYGHLSSVDSRFQQAKEAGLSLEDVAQHFDDKTPSALGAFGRSALQNVGPGALAASFGETAAIAAAPFAPVTFGLAPIVAGVGAGAATYLGAKWAQDKLADTVSPEGMFGTKAQQADYEAHPIVSTAGSVLGGGGPLSPGSLVKNLGTVATRKGWQGVRAAGQQLSTKEGAQKLFQAAAENPTGAEAKALEHFNTAVGTGTGMAVNAAIAAKQNGNPYEAAGIAALGLGQRPWVGSHGVFSGKKPAAETIENEGTKTETPPNKPGVTIEPPENELDGVSVDQDSLDSLNQAIDATEGIAPATNAALKEKKAAASGSQPAPKVEHTADQMEFPLVFGGEQNAPTTTSNEGETTSQQPGASTNPQGENVAAGGEISPAAEVTAGQLTIVEQPPLVSSADEQLQQGASAATETPAVSQIAEAERAKRENRPYFNHLVDGTKVDPRTKQQLPSLESLAFEFQQNGDVEGLKGILNEVELRASKGKKKDRNVFLANNLRAAIARLEGGVVEQPAVAAKPAAAPASEVKAAEPVAEPAAEQTEEPTSGLQDSYYDEDLGTTMVWDESQNDGDGGWVPEDQVGKTETETPAEEPVVETPAEEPVAETPAPQTTVKPAKLKILDLSESKAKTLQERAEEIADWYARHTVNWENRDQSKDMSENSHLAPLGPEYLPDVPYAVTKPVLAKARKLVGDRVEHLRRFAIKKGQEVEISEPSEPVQDTVPEETPTEKPAEQNWWYPSDDVKALWENVDALRKKALEAKGAAKAKAQKKFQDAAIQLQEMLEMAGTRAPDPRFARVDLNEMGALSYDTEGQPKDRVPLVDAKWDTTKEPVEVGSKEFRSVLLPDSSQHWVNIKEIPQIILDKVESNTPKAEVNKHAGGGKRNVSALQRAVKEAGLPGSSREELIRWEKEGMPINGDIEASLAWIEKNKVEGKAQNTADREAIHNATSLDAKLGEGTEEISSKIGDETAAPEESDNYAKSVIDEVMRFARDPEASPADRLAALESLQLHADRLGIEDDVYKQIAHEIDAFTESLGDNAQGVVDEAREISASEYSPEEIMAGHHREGDAGEAALRSPAAKETEQTPTEPKLLREMGGYELVRRILNHRDSTPLQRTIAEILLKNKALDKILVRVFDHLDVGTEGEYDPSLHTISFSRENSLNGGEFDPNTGLHEIFHALTKAFFSPANRAYLTESQRVAVSGLRDLFARSRKAAEKMGLTSKEKYEIFTKESGRAFSDEERAHYGWSNVDEFISEAMTNPDFQDMLRQIEIRNPITGLLDSAWNFYKSLVRMMLGLPRNDNSALSHAIDHIMELSMSDTPIGVNEKGQVVTGKRYAESVQSPSSEREKTLFRVKHYGYGVDQYVHAYSKEQARMLVAKNLRDNGLSQAAKAVYRDGVIKPSTKPDTPKAPARRESRSKFNDPKNPTTYEEGSVKDTNSEANRFVNRFTEDPVKGLDELSKPGILLDQETKFPAARKFQEIFEKKIAELQGRKAAGEYVPSYEMTAAQRNRDRAYALAGAFKSTAGKSLVMIKGDAEYVASTYVDTFLKTMLGGSVSDLTQGKINVDALKDGMAKIRQQIADVAVGSAGKLIKAFGINDPKQIEQIKAELGDLNSDPKNLKNLLQSMMGSGADPQKVDALAKQLHALYNAAHARMAGKRISELVNSTYGDLTYGSRKAALAERLSIQLKPGRFDEDKLNGALLDSIGIKGYNEAAVKKLRDQVNYIQSQPEGSAQRNQAVDHLKGALANMEMNQLLKGGIKGSIEAGLELIPDLFRSAVLTSPSTTTMHGMGGLVNTRVQAFFDAFGHSLSAINKGASVSESLGFFKDLMDACLTAEKGERGTPLLREAWRALRTGSVGIGLAKGTGKRGADLRGDGVGSKAFQAWCKALAIPGRLMSAWDAMNGGTAKEVNQRYAMRAALLNMGYKGPEIAAEMKRLFAPTQDEMKAAREALDREVQSGAFAPFKGEDQMKFGSEQYFLKGERLEQLHQQIVAGADLMKLLGSEHIQEKIEQYTYKGRPRGIWGAGSDLLNTLNKHSKVSTLLVPFTNIVGHLMNTALDFTPFGYARAENMALSHLFPGMTESKYAWPEMVKGSPDQIALKAKSILGTVATSFIVSYFLKELHDEEMTGKEPTIMFFGTGPRDPAKRKTWMAAGARPDTLKIGDHYFPYKTLPAISLLGAMLGAMHDMYIEESEPRVRSGKRLTPQEIAKAHEFTAEKAMRLGVALAMAPLTHEYLNGLRNVITVAHDPEGPGAAKAVINQVTGSLSQLTNPSLLRTIRNANPFEANSEGNVANFDFSSTMGKLFQFVPAYIGYDKRALNIMGDPIEHKFFSPLTDRWVYAATAKPDPRMHALYSNGLYLPDVRRGTPIITDRAGTIMKVSDAGDEALRAFTVARGEFLKRVLTPELINRLTQMDREQAQAILLGPSIAGASSKYAQAIVERDILQGRIKVNP